MKIYLLFIEHHSKFILNRSLQQNVDNQFPLINNLKKKNQNKENNHSHYYQPKMTNLKNSLINIYIITTLAIFSYVCWEKLNTSDNYFAAAMFILQNQFTKLLIYNLIITLATIVYRLTISLFYEEIKQNQSFQLVEKLGYKIVQLLYFLYVIGGSNIGLHTFLSITVIFLMFTFHNVAISRSKFLINAHSHQYMGLNYRLLAHFLIMLFIDFQMINYTFLWLFNSEQEDSSYVLFAYYCITISLTIIEPIICFIFHFYQIFTNNLIEDSDLSLIRINFIVIIPRICIQVLLSIFIADKFSLHLLMILKMIQPIMEINKTAKQLYWYGRNYYSIRKLIDKMKNLKELNKQAIEKQHDKTCTVCFSQTTTSAILLPCRHIFHKECLRQWIIKNSNNYCPKCKKVFDFENVHKVDIKIMKLNQFQEFRKKQQENKENHQKYNPFQFSKNQNRNHLIAMQYDNNFQPRNDNTFKSQNTNNNQSKLQSIRKNIKKKKSDEVNIGSVPFGIPTQAIYRRKAKDIQSRKKIMESNEKMLKLMKMEPVKQIILIPEFQ